MATWSADGRFLAVKRDYDYLGEGADVEVWNVSNSQRVFLLTAVAWGCVAFHPQHPWLLVGQGDSDAVMLDLEDAHEVSRFSLVARPMHLRFSADGTRFAAVCMPANRSRHTISVQQVETGAILWTNTSNPIIGAVNWHPDGQSLAVSDYRGSISLIDASTGEMRTLGQHKAEAVTALFTPDGRYLFSGGWERELICWDLRSSQRVFVIGVDGYEMQIRADGRQCAIRTRSGLQLHALEMPLHREFAENLGSRLRRAAFSPDGRWLAAAGERHGAVWDLAHRAPGAVSRQAADANFHFTSDGREMLSGSGNRWQITPTANGAMAPRLTPLPIRKPADFSSLCLVSNQVIMNSSNGSQIIAMGQLDSDNNGWVPTQPGSSRVSSDGRWLGISPAFYETLYVYKLPGLEEAARLKHPAGIGGFEFSPLGKEVAIYSSRAGVEFWSTGTWQRTRVLTNFNKVIMTPDGQGWWLINGFRQAWLCEPETLRELLPLPVDMLPLAISADGRHLAVSVESRRLQLWNLEEVRKQLRDLGLDWESAPRPAAAASR